MWNRRLGILLLLAGLTSSTAAGERLVIKLATLAPKDSTWHKILETMGEKWKKASAGEVQLRIFAGTLGDESDIMRRIRVGQLQAAAVTTVGLGTVDASTQALHVPLAFASHEELDYVQSRIAPRMEKALHDKGLVVLNWGDAGWVHFFTKAPVARPSDLKKLKIFVWATGASSDDIWKDKGFQPVSLSAVDILPGLQTGMISAIQAPPLAALANQWFAFTKYMTDLQWAPLTGATIISRKTWDQVPAQLQPEFLKAAGEAGAQLQTEIRKLEKEALDAMTKRGLQIVPVPPDAAKEWATMVESIYPRIRGEMIPPEYFDEVLRLRNEYRAGRGGARGGR
jgi:TRAP-type C4-dicarboxylate transport system substrate-binding protein